MWLPCCSLRRLRGYYSALGGAHRGSGGAVRCLRFTAGEGIAASSWFVSDQKNASPIARPAVPFDAGLGLANTANVGAQLALHAM